MRKAMLALSATLAVTLAAGILGPIGIVAADPASDAPEKDYIEVVEELDPVAEKTDPSGWGTLHEHQTWEAKPIIANGVDVSHNSVGTHVAPPSDEKPERDIVYDISKYSTEYTFFQCLVGQPDGGARPIKFTILTSSEEDLSSATIVDQVVCGGAPSYAHGYITTGAKYLILRYRSNDSTHSDGTCAFIDVRLMKPDDTSNIVHAGKILKRYDPNMVSATGWAPDNKGYTVFYNTDLGGESFYHVESAGGQSAPVVWGEETDIGFDDWLSLHLKSIAGSNGDIEGSGYAIYEQNKNDATNYISLKWDIKDQGFTYFSALGYDSWGWGFHGDIWIDGTEVFKSGWIKSAATIAAPSSPEEDVRNTAQEIGCAIPANAQTLELRIIADSAYNNGDIRIIEPTFFKSGADKLSHYASTQQAGTVWFFETARGRMWDGQPTTYRDCANDNADVTVGDGFFFVAGDSKDNATAYTFDLEGVTGNTLVANLGRAPYYPDETTATPVYLHYEATDEEGNVTSSGVTEGVDWENSGIEVTIPLGKDAKELSLWVTSENRSFSETVLANGHFVTKRSVSFNDGTTTKVELYDDNADINQPQNPTKTGYNFVEWRKKGESSAFNFEGAKATEDLELEAVWAAQQYDITYMQQLGDDTETDVSDYTPATHTYGTATTLPEAHSVEGYTFDGWYVDGSKVTELAADGYTGDITVTAKYDIVVLDVEFFNGDAQIAAKEVNYGSKVDTSGITAPTKTGYDFAGWQKKTGDAYEDFSLDTDVKEDLQLYAKWTPHAYTVTYKQQLGGNAATEVSDYTPKTHVYGTATKLPAAKTVAGYTFEGWYVGNTKVTELAADGYIDNITVTARYRVATVNVTFVTGEGEEETLQYDVGSTIGDKTSTREGYTFEGWYLDEDCTESYDTSSAVESDLTLYAKWKSESKGGCGSVLPATAGVAGALLIAGVCAVLLIRRKKQDK